MENSRNFFYVHSTTGRPSARLHQTAMAASTPNLRSAASRVLTIVRQAVVAGGKRVSAAAARRRGAGRRRRRGRRRGRPPARLHQPAMAASAPAPAPAPALPVSKRFYVSNIR